MTPWDVAARAAEIAARHGPDVWRAWETIWQTLRSEMPELDRRPAPTADDAAEAAREAGRAHQDEAAERRLRELGRVDTDPLGVELPEPDPDRDL